MNRQDRQLALQWWGQRSEVGTTGAETDTEVLHYRRMDSIPIYMGSQEYKIGKGS